MKLTINNEFQSLLFPLTTTEYDLLEASIVKDGCRDPLVVTGSTLMDGHNRYGICQKHSLAFNTSSLCFPNEQAAKDWIDLNQLGKRNLTDDQLRIVRGRTYNRVKTVGHGKKSGVQNAPQIKTAERVGKDFGVSQDTIKRDAKFAERVAKSPELQAAIRNKVPVKQLEKQIKVDARKQQVETIKQKIASENKTITNKFDVCVIDPPWDYKEKGGFGIDEHDPESNRGGLDYPSMSVGAVSEIKLPLKENAVVFLWTTHAFLHDAFHLLDKWGLTYKATLVWDKEKMGIGRTVRMQCEFCLLAVKGNPLIQGSAERDIIRETRREHSRKPEAFYKMVERMTTGTRLDYFSREQRKGWETYGAETNKF